MLYLYNTHYANLVLPNLCSKDFLLLKRVGSLLKRHRSEETFERVSVQVAAALSVMGKIPTNCSNYSSRNMNSCQKVIPNW